MADVTQTLAVCIVPVNNPSKGRKHGYYRAYVAGADNDSKVFVNAQLEIARGIVPSNVGYATHSTARIAALDAIDNYEDKFGPLCTD